MSESRPPSSHSCSSSISGRGEWQSPIDCQSDQTTTLSNAPHHETSSLSSLSPPPTNRWSFIEDTASTTIGSCRDLNDHHSEDQDHDKNVITTEALQSDAAIELEALPEAVEGIAKISIRRAFLDNWKKFVPHLFSILVTAGVVQLSFRNVYWMDLKSPSKEITPGLTQGGALNFLQLAAKLHELLILASISSIVLHAVQSHLTGTSGLPLGMIANSFELTSGQFLRRKAFWTLPWSKDPNTGKRSLYIRFWLLSLFAALLVVLSGPSSAIAVIPTLNYFDMAKPFNAPVLPYFVFNQSTELWPTVLTGESLNSPTSGRNCTDPLQSEACPSSGYNENLRWGGYLELQSTDHGSNITYTDNAASMLRVVTTRSCNRTAIDGRASAVGLPAFVSNAFTDYWKFAQDNFQGVALEASQPRMKLDTNVFAPKVEVLCNGYLNADSPNVTDPSNQTAMFFPTWSNLSSFPVPDWTFRYPRLLNSSNFTLYEIPNNGPETPSLGAVITIPVVQGRGSWDDFANISWYQTTENLACSVYAQWVPVDAWYEPNTDDAVEFTVSSDLGDTCLETPTTDHTRRPPINATISQEYANGINSPIEFITGPIPALLGIIQYLIFPDPEVSPDLEQFHSAVLNGHGNLTNQEASRLRAKLISTILAGVVTDGMARIAGNGDFPYSAPVFLEPNRTSAGELQGVVLTTTATYGDVRSLNTTNISDADDWLKIDFSFSRYGYGYKWHGSRTAQFGISVLLLHIAVAVCHTLLVLVEIFGGRRAVHRAWETIPEMFVLAMNSSPSERLRRAYAKDGTIKSWREVVAVRESDRSVLEVVVGREDVEHSAPARRGTGFSTIFQASSKK